MACLACVGACSEAFYKVFDPDKACLQIVEKKAVRPIACPQCGKCAEACPEGAITQNPKGVYMINKKQYNLKIDGKDVDDLTGKMYGMRSLCEGLSIWPDRKNRGKSGFQMYRLRYLRESLPDGCTGSCGRIMIRTLRYRQDLM